MTINYIKYGLASVGILALVLMFAAYSYGAVTFTTPTGPVDTYKNFTFFSATTTSATSTNVTGGGGYFVIAGAKKVTMYFTHGGTATTSTTGATFKVETSRDGVIWNPFNKLLGTDMSSTATSSYAIQGATSTVPVALDLSDDVFYGLRCHSTEFAAPLGTDGESTCIASAEF